SLRPKPRTAKPTSRRPLSQRQPRPPRVPTSSASSSPPNRPHGARSAPQPKIYPRPVRPSNTLGRALSPRPESRQGPLLVHRLEDHLDRHPHRELVVRALDDVRVGTDALLELDDRHVVGHVLEEGGVLRAMDDDEGIDGPAAGQPHPLAALRQAVRAEDARRPAELAAPRTALRAQLALPAALPEGRVVLGDGGQCLPPPEHHPPPPPTPPPSPPTPS